MMTEPNFLAKFKARVKEIDGTIPNPSRYSGDLIGRIKHYRLVTEFAGRRKIVAFNIPSYIEASILFGIIHKRMVRLAEKDDAGNPLFEATQIIIEQEKN